MQLLSSRHGRCALTPHTPDYTQPVSTEPPHQYWCYLSRLHMVKARMRAGVNFCSCGSKQRPQGPSPLSNFSRFFSITFLMTVDLLTEDSLLLVCLFSVLPACVADESLLPFSGELLKPTRHS